MSRSRAALVVVLAAALLCSGCHGQRYRDDTNNPPLTPLTQAAHPVPVPVPAATR